MPHPKSERIVLLLIVVGALFISAYSTAQTDSPPVKQELKWSLENDGKALSLECQAISLRSIFRELDGHTALEIVNYDEVPEVPISVRFEKVELRLAMEQLIRMARLKNFIIAFSAPDPEGEPGPIRVGIFQQGTPDEAGARAKALDGYKESRIVTLSDGTEAIYHPPTSEPVYTPPETPPVYTPPDEPPKYTPPENSEEADKWWDEAEGGGEDQSDSEKDSEKE